MSNFSSNSPIENIGALELGRASVLLSDDALEATAASLAAPTSANNCGTIWPCARRIDDGALENAAVTVMAGPTIAPCTVMTCSRIDDGALEASAGAQIKPNTNPRAFPRDCIGPEDDALEASAGYAMAGPTIQYCNTLQGPPRCPRYIDDAALEAAAVATSGPTIQYCNTLVGANCPRRIDDGALEAVAVTGPGQTIITYCVCPRVDDGELEAAIDAPVPTTVHTGCYHIRVDDSELEATAGILHANPTGAGNICNMTGPLMCPKRIDDGELETAAAMTASPSYDTVCASTVGRRCLRDSAN